MQKSGADSPRLAGKAHMLFAYEKTNNCMLQPGTSDLKSGNVAELVSFWSTWLPCLCKALSLAGEQLCCALCNGRRHRVRQPSKERRK